MKEIGQNNWHTMQAEEVVQATESDLLRGLTKKEAVRRKRACGNNALWRVNRASVTHTALGEFLDLAAILLIITASIAAVFGHGDEAVVIALILVVSAVFRTVTYIAAQRIFEDAARTNLPCAAVLRDGKRITLPADAVVPGDVLLLSPGDPVVADARLLTGEVTVLEAGITENRGSQRKWADVCLQADIPCESRTNILFAGSTVLSGSARCIVVASGERTYLFTKHGPVTVPAGEDIPVLERLSGWCRNVSLVMIAAVLIITLGGVFVGQNQLSLDVLFLSALSVAVASMSEFLCVIAAIILAVSVQKLMHKTDGAVTMRSPVSIERLAEAKCIILESDRLLRTDSVVLHGAFQNGTWSDGSALQVDDGLMQMLSLSLLCRGVSMQSLDSGSRTANNSELTEMIRILYTDLSQKAQMPPPLLRVIEEDHTGALHTVLAQTDDAVSAYVCGEVADVLACCSGVLVDGNVSAVTAEEKNAWSEQARVLSRSGIRTVAVATRISPYTNLAKKSALHSKMLFLGFFAITVPMDTETLLLLEKCRNAQISIAILSSRPKTDCATLTDAGILQQGSETLSNPREVESFADRIGSSESDSESVCIAAADQAARAQVIRAISERIPETVFVCDSFSGVSLCKAAPNSAAVRNRFRPITQSMLRMADVSVSRADSSTASGVAEVLRIISVCRSALIRLSNAAEYLLTVQALRLTLMFVSAFFGLPMLTPIETLWWGLILDFAAVLTFAFADADSDILLFSRRKMLFPSWRNGMVFPLSLGVLGGVLLSCVSAYCSVSAGDAAALSVCFSSAVLASFVLLAAILFFRKGRWKRSVRVNIASVIYALLTVLTVVFFVLGVPAVFLSFLPVAAVIMVLVRFLYNKLSGND
ncbi:MAG: cation-transporting P-type ATPase [Clostridia bacterium]|nr:cation-transporting P-type ATPase [Clostridia bacterium]